MQRKLLRVYRNQSDPNKVIEIELYYDLGGMSYATSSVNPRGYYLSAVPRIYGDFHGTRVKMTSAFSGVHSLIKPPGAFTKTPLPNWSLLPSMECWRHPSTSSCNLSFSAIISMQAPTR
jgi:hypothetical protein